MRPDTPLIDRLEPGALFPIPTFPFPKTVRSEAFVVDATVKSGKAPDCWAAVETESVENGDVVPMPALVELTVSVGVEEKPTWNVLAVLLVNEVPSAKAKSAVAFTLSP